MPDLVDILNTPPPFLDGTLPLGNSAFPMLLRRAWYGLNQAFRRRVTHLDMTPDQYTVMRTLTQGCVNGLTQKELTTSMSSDPNTVASLLERMERAGFIDRMVDPNDRRARRILLKPFGNERFLKAKDIAMELQNEVLQSLSEKRKTLFLQELATIADFCREAAENSPRKSNRTD
ncbi:MAG: MarR family transcriptional regulator [Verrucomicrobia bacterium]|jgi:MarR family transcriptional regulator, transcriptional regulator for hemolysin|nr:MarR family transcriptional regulator [Verrucomicrobiota bacterium]